MTLKRNNIIITVLFGKSKTVSFASSIMKYNIAAFAVVRFTVKISSCIGFRSAFNFSCLLKFIAINLKYFCKYG